MKLIPHGYLADILPPEINLEAETPAEAINGLCQQYREMDPVPGKGRHQIKLGGFDTVDSLYEPTSVEEIHIYPDFSGAKGGFLQVLIGTAIVAAAFTIPGAQGLSATAFQFAGASITYGNIALVGAAIALGGVTQLMSPSPQFDSTGQDSESFTFSPKENTVQIGTRIPVLYGRHRFGGHYVSFNIDAVDINEEGKPSDQPDPPPAASVSASADLDDDEVDVTWTLPTDDEIKSVTATDGFGQTIHPYPNGRDSISHFILSKRFQQSFGPGGTRTVTETINDRIEYPTTSYTVDSLPEVSEYSIQVVYNNGDVSAKTTSPEVEGNRSPFHDPTLDEPNFGA
jgi:predicted phage tail protein